MKIIAITQARTGSTRFKNKVLERINDKTLLEIHCRRVQESKRINQLVIATTEKVEDDAIEKLSGELKIPVFRGSENDVLDRFYKAALKWKPDRVVRVTSDCPLIDPELIDQVIEFAVQNDYDYAGNVLVEAYPDGQDIEVFKFSALEKAWTEARLISEREHVTPYIRLNSTFFGKNLFRSGNFPAPGNFNKVRMTVDEPVDLEVIKKLIERCGGNQSWVTYAQEYLSNPAFASLNQDIQRNEGYQKSLKQDKS